MAEKDKITKEELKNKGIFDFSGLYNYAYEYFRTEGYGVNEDEYAEKIAGECRDVKVKWKATKGVSDYFKFEIKFEIGIRGMSDVEVEIDGQKKQMNKGEIKFKIEGFLVKDPKSKWENSAFERFLRDVYNKYIVPNRVDDMEDILLGDIRSLKDELKALMDHKARR